MPDGRVTWFEAIFFHGAVAVLTAVVGVGLLVTGHLAGLLLVGLAVFNLWRARHVEGRLGWPSKDPADYAPEKDPNIRRRRRPAG
ncbi:hypothetical protein [Baekduia sp. Peel2402]|uniref:hypothetical protein n=1 Tax=Baekduia sp. Peel2402 TaxID=3458296 RepID=UPI00403E3D5A